MAKASALLVTIAACGALPVEASHMKRLADGPLVAYDDGGRLLVAPRGCADSTCMAFVGNEDRNTWFARIEPLAPSGWFLVRRSWSMHSWSGEGSSEGGTIVQLGHLSSAPRVGCPITLSSRGCSTEWGFCTESTTTLAPGGDGTFLARTIASGGRDEPAGARITCQRLAIGAKGCEVHDVACPAR